MRGCKVGVKGVWREVMYMTVHVCVNCKLEGVTQMSNDDSLYSQNPQGHQSDLLQDLVSIENCPLRRHCLRWARWCGPWHPVDRIWPVWSVVSSGKFTDPVFPPYLVTTAVWSKPRDSKSKTWWTRSVATSVPIFSILVTRAGNEKSVHYLQPMNQGPLTRHCLFCQAFIAR